MNWKCVLVGLILVFPGTLFSVEGRYYEEDRALSEDGYLKTLLEFFHNDQAEVEKYSNSQADPAAPAPIQKKHNTNNNNNNQQQQAEDDDNDEKITTNDEEELGPPAENEPSFSATAGGGKQMGDGAVFSHGKGGGGMVNQIDKAAQGPHALAQSHRVSSGGGEGNAVVPATNTVFILVVAGCTVLAAAGIVGAGVAWYKYNRSAKAASVVDYPAYGVTGPTKDRAPSPGDRKLAHSAQMYHYQHQKQQMMAMQGASSGEMKHDGSDDESVEDNDDADYTVYECPGLAPTGEMEVKNPLFCGDETPSTPANDETRQTPPEY